MEKILLNNYSMNEAIAMLKNGNKEEYPTRYKVQCKNCTISVATRNLRKYTDLVSVALRTVDDSDYIETKTEYNGYINPIIDCFPLWCFAALTKQFHNLEPEYFAEVWDAWDTIAANFPL